MIISHVNGGLGNQLFQYAAGKALATRLGVSLGLDLRHFDRNPAHDLALGHFNVSFEKLDQNRLPPSRHRNPIGHLVWRGLGLKPRLYREKSLGYNDAFGRLNDKTYLKGYWQSERYFADITDIIRHDLEIITAPDERNRAMRAEMENKMSVSLHVRRGDYVADAATNATHGTCSVDYYSQAAELIATKTKTEPVIFCFSDDPEWVAAEIKLPFPMRVVGHNDASHNYEDLRLMNACRHHVIANSSFSWWGAWLNPSPDKIVVAPNRWFAHPGMNNPDIIPDGWVRI